VKGYYPRQKLAIYLQDKNVSCNNSVVVRSDRRNDRTIRVFAHSFEFFDAESHREPHFTVDSKAHLIIQRENFTE